jgi:flagellar basal-body rod protein FlgF
MPIRYIESPNARRPKAQAAESAKTTEGSGMLRGIYSAACAMEAASRNQEIVSENLAHVTTPGYRRQAALFDVGSFQDDLHGATQAMGNTNNPIGFTHFDPGPMQQTNNPYDLAVVGNAFFVVQGPSGPVYTRNGAFERTPDGQLQLRGNTEYRLGGVQIPADAGRVDVSPEGVIYANGAEVGRVQLATFERPETLRRIGTTFFAGDNAQTPTIGTARVEQGYRENSNVQPVQEMVSMMLGLRQYEAAEKALRAIAEAVGLNTRAQT